MPHVSCILISILSIGYAINFVFVVNAFGQLADPNFIPGLANTQIQCTSWLEGGAVIIDLTCPGHTQVIRGFLGYGYLTDLQTANEMYLVPSTDTIEIMKEKGGNLNYTLGLPK